MPLARWQGTAKPILIEKTATGRKATRLHTPESIVPGADS